MNDHVVSRVASREKSSERKDEKSAVKTGEPSTSATTQTASVSSTFNDPEALLKAEHAVRTHPAIGAEEDFELSEEKRGAAGEDFPDGGLRAWLVVAGVCQSVLLQSLKPKFL